MIYIIDRASERGLDCAPCKEAVKRSFEYWHIRTCTEAEFDERFSRVEGLWRSKGKNHKVNENGYITRQEDNVTRWSVEITTIKQLEYFVNDYGDIIIYKEDGGIKAPLLLIYDDNI